MDADTRSWKRLARARLSCARSGLLEPLLGLSRATLESESIFGFTPAEALAAIAEKDRSAAVALDPAYGVEPRNHSENGSTGPTLSNALDRLLRARSELLSALARVPDGDLFAARQEGSFEHAIDERETCDRRCAQRFARWRATRPGDDTNPPRDLLLAAMRAARKELLTEIALIPEDERHTHLVGPRTLLQELVAIADEESSLLLVVERGRRERPSNRLFTWQEAWRRLHDTHHQLVQRLEDMPEVTLNGPLPPTQVYTHSPYDGVRAGIARDRALAAALRST